MMNDPRNPDRLSELVARHPRLFAGRAPDRSHLSPGWFELVDKLCADLEALAAPGGGGELPFRVEQVKEKFGSLRVYVHATAPGSAVESLLARAQALVKAAAKQSESVCEGCGAASELHQNALRWWNTLCPACEARKGAARVGSEP